MVYRKKRAANANRPLDLKAKEEISSHCDLLRLRWASFV